MIEITEITVVQGTYQPWLDGPLVAGERPVTGCAKSDKPFVLGSQINLGCCGYGGHIKLRGRATVTSTYWDKEPELILTRVFGRTCVASHTPLYGLAYGAELALHGPGRVEVVANG